jgi:hypothetical protein
VDAFMARTTRLAHDTAAALAAAAAASGAAASPTSSSSSSSSDQQWSSLRGLPAMQVVTAIEHCLFKEQQQQQQQQQWYSSASCAGFTMPAYGRSNLPKKALLDHPGAQRTAAIHFLHRAQPRVILNQYIWCYGNCICS